jgi:hypothetical protein
MGTGDCTAYRFGLADVFGGILGRDGLLSKGGGKESEQKDIRIEKLEAFFIFVSIGWIGRIPESTFSHFRI